MQSGNIIPVDSNCVALFHYDITENDILYGIYPNQNISTLRPMEGYFGGGIAIEEGTTNLLNISDTRWVINRSNYQGTVYVTTQENQQFHTSALFDFEPKSNISGGGWQVAQYNTSMTFLTGNYYTWSIYINRKTSDQVTIKLLDSNGLNQQGPTITTNNTTAPIGSWSRLTGTWTPTMTSGGGAFYMTASENAKFEVSDPQIEKKSFPTSFINGTRINGVLRYPLDIINTSCGTINFWVNIQGSTTSQCPIFSSGKDGGFDLLYQDPNNNLYLRGYSSSTTSTQLRPSKIPLNTWTMITIVWVSGSKFALYQNGELDVISNTPQDWGSYYLQTATGFYIGSGIRSNSNIIIDELRIDNIARSDEEIMSWYISQRPFYPKGIYTVAY